MRLIAYWTLPTPGLGRVPSFDRNELFLVEWLLTILGLLVALLGFLTLN